MGALDGNPYIDQAVTIRHEKFSSKLVELDIV